MDNPVGKSFKIPDFLTQSVKKIYEEKESAYASAKVFMQEAEKLNKNLSLILEEHLEVLQGHQYVVDLNTMTVTVMEKSYVDKEKSK